MLSRPKTPLLSADDVGRVGVSPLTADEFADIAHLVYSEFGLDLRKGKELMVSSRLMRHVRAQNCTSFSEYLRRVIEDSSGAALSDMIDALTTNFTSFWREAAHFEFLGRTIAPVLISRQAARVWCAAAATGEEPYSIAICLLEAFGRDHGLPLEILATDLSSRALETASKGIYQTGRLRTLDRKLIVKYFLNGNGAFKGACRIQPEVRRLVQFRRLNLIGPLPNIGTFDVIFCRNVMIYFDHATQFSTVRRLVEHLAPEGYLIIGHSESLTGFDCPLRYVRPGVYRKTLRADCKGA
jgi:chemotaxis protein methyltransferase CheR